MSMDDFESKLKALTPAKPSAELRRRIFVPERKRRSWAEIVNIRIPLNMAATLALVAGLGGYFSAQAGRADSNPDGMATPSYKVIYQQAPTPGNPFDFTTTPSEFKAKGEYEVNTNDEV